MCGKLGSKFNGLFVWNWFPFLRVSAKWGCRKNQNLLLLEFVYYPCNILLWNYIYLLCVPHAFFLCDKSFLQLHSIVFKLSDCWFEVTWNSFTDFESIEFEHLVVFQLEDIKISNLDSYKVISQPNQVIFTRWVHNLTYCIETRNHLKRNKLDLLEWYSWLRVHNKMQGQKKNYTLIYLCSNGKPR